jgi:hypothetical protein
MGFSGSARAGIAVVLIPLCRHFPCLGTPFLLAREDPNERKWAPRVMQTPVVRFEPKNVRRRKTRSAADRYDVHKALAVQRANNRPSGVRAERTVLLVLKPRTR